MKNNSIFQKDEGNFRKKTNERSTCKGKVLTMDKFVKIWADIQAGDSETPNKKRMEKIKESMKDKIRQVQKLQTIEQELGKTIMKRKSWSILGIDEISNF